MPPSGSLIQNRNCISMEDAPAPTTNAFGPGSLRIRSSALRHALIMACCAREISDPYSTPKSNLSRTVWSSCVQFCIGFEVNIEFGISVCTSLLSLITVYRIDIRSTQPYPPPSIVITSPFLMLPSQRRSTPATKLVIISRSATDIPAMTIPVTIPSPYSPDERGRQARRPGRTRFAAPGRAVNQAAGRI